MLTQPPTEKDSPQHQAFKIGVVLPEPDPTIPPDVGAIEDLYFGPLFKGIRDALTGKSVEVVYANAEYSSFRMLRNTSSLDGMILVAPPLDALPALRQLLDENTNFVTVGLSLHTPEGDELPCLDTDNIQGAADAAKHLLALGHRDIAVVNLATDHSNHSDRQHSFERTLAEAGVPVHPDNLVLYRKHIMARFEERVEKWILQAEVNNSLPTAIFACDYMMALTVLRLLRRHKIRVPDDISVVGFDDPVSAAHLTPALTTVRQPVYQLGKLAAERLLNALLAGSWTVPPGAQILPTELILRESTAEPRSISVHQLDKDAQKDTMLQA